VVEVAQPSIAVVGPRSSGSGPVAAVALVLHGGRERSQAAVTPRQLALKRMRPFAGHLARAGGDHGLAVWTLQHRVRGWNGTERSPVADAEWALDEVTDRHGDVPVVLVGHSMGGRTAVHVAGHPRVVALAALAPWLPRGEPVVQVAGRAVLVVHGQLDTTTSARLSREWAREAAVVTDPVWWVGVRRDRHAMLWRAGLWHRLATEFTMGTLGFGPMPALLAGATGAGRLELGV
jgi:pimeloyl-ACP methyl ester carboxylesterase